jgi:mRNA interferase RelE/StbE
MSWNIAISRDYVKDLAHLPAKIRKRVEKLTFVELPLLTDPTTLNNLKKLKGYQSYYRIRFGDYRLGLEIDAKAKRISLLRVLHRRDIYRHFP